MQIKSENRNGENDGQTPKIVRCQGNCSYANLTVIVSIVYVTLNSKIPPKQLKAKLRLHNEKKNGAIGAKGNVMVFVTVKCMFCCMQLTKNTDRINIVLYRLRMVSRGAPNYTAPSYAIDDINFDLKSWKRLLFSFHLLSKNCDKTNEPLAFRSWMPFICENTLEFSHTHVRLRFTLASLRLADGELGTSPSLQTLNVWRNHALSLDADGVHNYKSITFFIEPSKKLFLHSLLKSTTYSNCALAEHGKIFMCGMPLMRSKRTSHLSIMNFKLSFK